VIDSDLVSTEIIKHTADYMQVRITDKNAEYIITVNLSGTNDPIDIGNGKQLKGKYSVVSK
jgi:hypothetical protein